jgi:hypothetical protein
MYLAYFGRPPDIAGLNYYLAQPDLTLAQLEINFSNSPESQALYATTSNAQLIDGIYMTLFNRHAEPDGVMFWSNAIDSGEITRAGAAYEIFNGAQNDDRATALAKLAVAGMWDQDLDTPAEIAGYSGDAANSVARAFMAMVTSDNLVKSLADAPVAITLSIGGDAPSPVTVIGVPAGPVEPATA